MQCGASQFGVRYPSNDRSESCLSRIARSEPGYRSLVHKSELERAGLIERGRRAERDTDANRRKKDGQGNGREKVLDETTQVRVAAIRRVSPIEPSTSSIAATAGLWRDAGRGVIASDEDSALASMRIRAVPHPPVLFAFADDTGLEQNRPRPPVDRSEEGPTIHDPWHRDHSCDA